MLELLSETYKFIIGFILAIFFTPIRKLIYAEEEQFCSFNVKGSNNYVADKIKVTKWFRKTTSINCGWFEDRTEKEFNNVKFLICPFGRKPRYAKNFTGGCCPFDKIPKNYHQPPN